MDSIGEYEFSKKDLIGHGAFAVVFKGRHKKKHDHVVAIKCITKKNLAKTQNLLSKEIKILKELSDLHHDNVVALLDCKETPNHVYLVMEYCNCGDLADYLQAQGTLSEDTIALFLRQIAGAMKALNTKGIVHRDMKPQNILLTHPRGSEKAPPHEIQLKIADFGFARFLQEGVMAGTLCGSPMYMAPEVIMSWQYTAKADLWSIGTIVYQCLTGKAPFRANTPQELKQFYERNADLKPDIPSGTSPELRHLLICLLRRNANDRIEFDDFFNHPYMHAKGKAASSSPMNVPRSRSRTSMGESPNVKTVTGSPLSTGGQPSSAPSPPPRALSSSPHVGVVMRVPASVTPAGRTIMEPAGQEPMDTASASAANTTADREDFVMVPNDIPLDTTPAAFDLKAIFSDQPIEGLAQPSGGAAKHTSPPRTVRPSPYSAGAAHHRTGSGSKGPSPVKTSPPSPISVSPVNVSPSRPSTLSVPPSPPSAGASPPTLQTSQPIPVPSQVKAYEQIQRSIQNSPLGVSGGLSVSPAPSPTSPSRPGVGSSGASSPGAAAGGVGSAPTSGAVTIPQRRGSSGSVASVGSMSPPSVQFSVGTPPHMCSGSWKRNVPAPMGSPHRKQGGAGKITVGSGVHLPPIVGSPTKTTPGFFNPPSDPLQPLKPAFAGGSKSRTCPSHLHEYQSPAYDNNSERSVVPVVMERSQEVSMERSRSTGTIKTAFGGQLPSPTSIPGITMMGQHSSSAAQGGAMLVPYGSSCPGGACSSSSSMSRTGSNTSLTRQRTYSDGMEPAAGMLHMPGHKSPTLDEPITFVAPELQEETLMDKEHNETVGKLNFMLGLVECIIELAQTRSSPLSQSMMNEQQQQQARGGFLLEQGTGTAFMTEQQRTTEQLVLYMRALHLITSSVNMAKDELSNRRLFPSSNVKTLLQDLNNYYHQCLRVCKNLASKAGTDNAKDGPKITSSHDADQLIFSYAMESCQTAALDELFGKPQDGVRRYRNSQTLLHGLSQQAHSDADRQLFLKYREIVEKRLFHLTRKGFVHAVDTSTNTMSTQDC